MLLGRYNIMSSTIVIVTRGKLAFRRHYTTQYFTLALCRSHASRLWVYYTPVMCAAVWLEKEVCSLKKKER